MPTSSQTFRPARWRSCSRPRSSRRWRAGFSGFGAALIFLPLAATVTDPKIASPLLLITDAVLALGFIPNAYRTADKREVGIMGLGARSAFRSAPDVLMRTDPLRDPLGRGGAGEPRCWRC